MATAAPADDMDMVMGRQPIVKDATMTAVTLAETVTAKDSATGVARIAGAEGAAPSAVGETMVEGKGIENSESAARALLCLRRTKSKS